jgi:hypothetical protein
MVWILVAIHDGINKEQIEACWRETEKKKDAHR